MTRYTRIAAFVLLALALLLGVYGWMLARQATARPDQPPAVSAAHQQAPARFAVVVAARTLPAGQPIEQAALRVVQLPIQPADALTDLAAAVGRVPVHDLGENTPLTQSQLVSGLGLRLASGERAVAVKADEVMSVGNKVRPGDFVDVFFALKSDSREAVRAQARLLLPRVRLLALGNASIEGGDGASGGRGAGSAPRQEIARTAVLAVPVEHVNRLLLADANARLLLALRRPDDMQLPDPALFAALPTALQPASGTPRQARRAPLQPLDQAHAGLALGDLAAGAKAPARVARRAPAPTARRASAPRETSLEVEVIRGATRETVRY